MSHQNRKGINVFKEIYATRDYGEAVTTISLLMASGFHPLELQTSSHVSIAGADVYYYVQVSDEESESAKEFLKDAGFKV